MKNRMNRLTIPLITVFAATMLTACMGGSGATSESMASNTPAATSMSTGTAENPQVAHISNDQLQQLLDQNVTLIDIRRPEEWAQTGVVQGSDKMTFFSKTGRINPNFGAELSRIAPDKTKRVALICRTGNRTRAGSQMLLQLGYKKVYNVRQGITQWIKEGRPVVR